MRVVTSFLCGFVIACLTIGVCLAQEKPQEYLIASTGEKVMGKADGTKQSKEYLPLHVKGYFNKGFLYKTRYNVDREEYVFFPSFQQGDDEKKFEKVTKLKMHLSGPISVYSSTINTPGGYSGWGGNYHHGGSTTTYLMDIEKNGTIIPFDSDQVLAALLEAIKDHKTLFEKVRVEEVKTNLARITQIIQEYNDWYESTHAMN
jgi:hypothetical protein